MQKEPEIKFKPLSSGLGFHSHSDGLPYAPSRKSSGTGAVQAGSVRFIPDSKLKFESVSVPQVEFFDSAEEKFTFGYLFKRAIAYLLDTVLNSMFCALAAVLVFWRLNLSFKSLLQLDLLILSVGFLLVFNWALIVAQEILFKTSIGKRSFGIFLDGNPSAILLRAVFFGVGLIFGGLGLWWAFFNKKKRCWHDFLVNSQPIEIARL